MVLKPVTRTCVLTSIAALGAITLSACSAGGTSGGGNHTNYITGPDGISTVSEGQRKSVGKIEGETLQGKHLDVADFKGKIVVINVWGSWCPPCRLEAPYLSKVAKELKSKGVEFVGVNVNDNSKVKPRAFEEDYKISYPSLHDPSGKILLSGFPKGTLSLQGIPGTAVLDRHAKIAARVFGAVDDTKLHKMIDPVLKEH